MKKMKNFKITILSLVLLVGTMLQSCNNSDPGLANIKMEMKATTALSSINPGGRVQGADFVFTDVLIGVTKIELESAEENEAEDNGDIVDKDGDGKDDIEFEGNYSVDLIAGVSTPDFGAADIAPGIYEELKLDLEPILADGNTMFIGFNYTPAGSATAIRYEYSNTDELEYELESNAGFELSDTSLNQLLVLFDLDAMFANVDLDAATADSDGVVRINDRSNANIAAQIAKNLDSVMEGGEDDDDDGEFDD